MFFNNKHVSFRKFYFHFLFFAKFLFFREILFSRTWACVARAFAPILEIDAKTKNLFDSLVLYHYLMQTIEQTAESKLISDLFCPPCWCYSVCWQAASLLLLWTLSMVKTWLHSKQALSWGCTVLWRPKKEEPRRCLKTLVLIMMLSAITFVMHCIFITLLS